MAKARFVYVTYIQSSPEKVWNALTDGEITKLYWVGRRNNSDWKVGSRWRHEDYDDPSSARIVGKVVESDRPRRLVVTWAYPQDENDPAKTSRVAYDIEPFRDAVRLTVTHDELEPESEMHRGISGGWPMVLASLKTLLETGRSMPMTESRFACGSAA